LQSLCAQQKMFERGLQDGDYFQFNNL